MNDRFPQSREALAFAREALKNGSKEEARRWAQRAAELAPQSEDPWLILATVSDNPQESVDFVRKALELNPDSIRAKKGMEWALQRSRELPKGPQSPGQTDPGRGAPQSSKKPVQSGKAKNPKRRSGLLPILLIVMGCAVFGFAAWSAVNSPALAAILNSASVSKKESARGPLFAEVAIAKPTYTPLAQQSVADIVIPSATLTAIPTAIVQESQAEIVSVPATDPPTLQAVVVPADTQVIDPATSVPDVTSLPGMVSAEIIADTPTSEYVAPTAAPYVPPVASSGGGEHWIDVNLSEQRVYAYAGDTVVNSFIVSTGVWQTPTVTGKYHIWIKLLSTTMTGPGYYLPNVPYTMYFYKGYGLHGTYWHNNFGTPMSHGCVNLRTDDAEWLYNFSSVGTLVNVHY
jgi:lipoprotein-anchoring transpeptidase ErfK/SrfK